jgi:uncharacterized membrane protein YdjX (TVP38/TMEM64 family)
MLCRLSPFLPFALMNVVLPYLGIRFRNFMIPGLIGMLPRTLFFLWAGTQFDNWTGTLSAELPNEKRMLIIVALTVTAIAGFLICWKKSGLNKDRETF